ARLNVDRLERARVGTATIFALLALLAVAPAGPAGAAPRPPAAAPLRPPIVSPPREPDPISRPARMAGDSTALPAAPSYEGVRLLPSGGSTIHFVVEVPEPELIPVAGDGEPGGAAMVGLDGYEPAAKRGEPALPQRIVVVAVPPVGEVRLRAQGGEATF